MRFGAAHFTVRTIIMIEKTMKRKIDLRLNIVRMAIMLLFSVVLIGDSAVQAQDFPMSLKRDSDLSPRNIGDYQKAIEKYKTAVCFEVKPDCQPNKDKAKEARDTLIYFSIAQIDLNYQKYRRNSRRARMAFDTLMDFLKLGADFAGVIVGGVRPKTVIAAASGFTQLTRDSAAKNLRLQDAQILFNKMDAKRAKTLGDILQKTVKDKKSVGDYPFELAWLDIIAYYRAGTFDEALADLSADTGIDKKIEEDKVRVLKGIPASPISTAAEAERAIAANDALIDLKAALDDPDGAKSADALKKLKTIAADVERDNSLKQLLAGANGASTQTGTAGGKAIADALTKIRRDARRLEAFDKLIIIDTAILQN